MTLRLGTLNNIIRLFPNSQHIKIENPPYMPLVIEHIGAGPRGLPLVSVAHYYEQNGDLMRDPEITFERLDGNWYPVSFTQDNLGIYQEAVLIQEGKVMVRPKLQRSLNSFARQWNSNIHQQGFLDAAATLKHKENQTHDNSR